MDEIYDFLVETEKNISIDWESSLNRACDMAHVCEIALIGESIRQEYRAKEKPGHRTPYAALKRIINQELPNRLVSDYSEEGTIQYLKLILPPSFTLPDKIGEHVNGCIDAAACLRITFQDMLKNYKTTQKEPLIKTYLRLYDILIDLVAWVEKLAEYVMDYEKNAIQGSINQKKTEQKEDKLKKVKAHPRYPEIIKKYAKHQSGKNKTEFNKLLNEITKVTNKVTLRGYRNDLLREYLDTKK